jgi:hypothetical protein
MVGELRKAHDFCTMRRDAEPPPTRDVGGGPRAWVSSRHPWGELEVMPAACRAQKVLYGP